VDLWYKKFYKESGGCFAGKAIDTWIILMPSVDSDPRYYGSSFTQSMIPLFSVCCGNRSADIRFIHRDFYFANPIGVGSEWLPGFLANKEQILPGHKRDSMRSWIASWHNNVYSCRAGVHWAVNNGVDEGEIAEGIKLAYERLENSKLVAYDSEYRASGNALMVKITQDGESLDVACANMAGDAVCSNAFKANDTIAELDAFLREEFPQCEPLTFWHESDKVPIETTMRNYTALTATMPFYCGDLPDLVQFPQVQAKFAIGECHGLAKEFGLQSYDGAQDLHKDLDEAEADIFFFADVESLSKEFDQAICQLRKAIPSNVVTVVMIAKEFESFKCPNFAYRLHAAVENVDVCVFAVLDEIDKVKSVFLRKPPAYPNGKCLAQAMIPFPRFHFFTLLGEDGKTCGRDVRDGSLLFTSVKYGNGAPTLPQQKLSKRQLIFGPDGPLHFATVPGESKATVILPIPILKDIFRNAVEAGCTEENEIDPNEALDNVLNLESEHMKYDEYSFFDGFD
jgi:hypothetical protein